MRKIHKNTGYTLLELLVALAVVGVLSAVAAPSLIDLVRKNALTTQTKYFSAAIGLARSEAIKRNTPVLICKRSGLACDATAEWHDGWIVFADADGDQAVDAGEEVRVFDAMTDGYTLSASTNITSFAFGADGMATSASGAAFSAVNFSLCAPDGNTAAARTLSMNLTGRLKRAEGVNACP